MANATATYKIVLKDQTKRAFKAIGRSLNSIRKSIFSMKTAFISAAGIAGIGFFVKKSMDATDEMSKMSRAIGVSIEELQSLRHAASLGGLEATQLDKAVQKLAINMADMSRGVGLAKDVFEKHNISVKNADGTLRSVMDVMDDVADVTASMTNATEKADLAYKLFGARGAKMINMLEGGSEAMRESMKEAERLGLVMSAETAEGVERANDAITRLSSFLTSSFRQSIAYVAPLIETVANSLREFFEMKIDEKGGAGKLALTMAQSFVTAAETILLTFQDVGNGIINFVADIVDAFSFMRGFEKVERHTIDLFDEFWALRQLSSGLTNQIMLLEAENLAASAAIDKNTTSVDKQTNSYKLLNIQLQELVPNFDLVGDHMDRNQAIAKEATVWDKMKDGFKSYFDSVKNGSLSLATITQGALQSAEDAIVNMMMGVKTNWKSLFKAILADLIRLQLRKALLGAFGGFFANGGRPPVGRPSIVGEKGAELFVPDSAGTIIPNHELGGSSQHTTAEINFNVQAIDAASFNTYLVNNRDTIESVINNSLLTNGSVRRTIQMVG